MKATFFVKYDLARKKKILCEPALPDLQNQTFDFKLDVQLHVVLSFPVSWVVVDKRQMHANIMVQIILF